MQGNNTTGLNKSKYRLQVQKAITQMDTEWATSSDEQLIQLFQSQGLSHSDAADLVLFLPIAFCRTLLPFRKWDDMYFLMNADKSLTEKKYADTLSYQIMLEETIRYFQQPSKELVQTIAGRSAEFKVLNDLLLKNPASKIEDIIISRLIVVGH